MGFSAVSTAQAGGVALDVLCGAYGFNFLFEIKNPAQQKSKQKLTAYEEKFIDTWRGDVKVIYTTEDAVAHIKEKMRRYSLA